jgi:hypothetical protein
MVFLCHAGVPSVTRLTGPVPMTTYLFHCSGQNSGAILEFWPEYFLLAKQTEKKNEKKRTTC